MSLEGKKIVFTGTLSMKRAEAKKKAEAAGAKVLTAVSGNTDIIVAGSGSGSKLDAAAAKGIKVWTEEEFVKAVEDVEEEEKPKKDAKKRAAPAKRTTRSAKKKEEEEEDEEDDEEEEPAPKKTKRQAATRGRGKAKKKEEEEEEEEEEEKPAPKKKAPARKAAAKGKAKKKEEEEEEDEEEEEEEEKKEEPKKEEPKKEEKKEGGAAAGGPRSFRPDRSIPGAANYSVWKDYAIKLNQTNIGQNNNKFYFIQLLEKGGNFYLWTRWGRVGEEGQHKLDPRFGKNEAAAIKAFEAKFKEKTQNLWSNRDSFVKKPGKYQLVDTDENDEGGDNSVPLGKLSKPQIEKGFEVLKKIEEALNNNKKGQLEELSSAFFSLIPTNFGRARPQPIRTLHEMHEKEELLKFYLRMGFEEMKEEEGLTPISGVMDLEVPKSLKEAAAHLCSAMDITNSENRGKDLAAKQAGNPKRKMDAHLYAAIMLYTSNAIYANLNKVLRDQNRAAVKKYYQYLRLLFEAMDYLPQQKCTLWRGISVDLSEQYKVGSTVVWWGVSSCTSDEQVARNFMKGCGGKCTLLTVDCKTACDISQITFYSNEKESLLAPGTQLLVKDVKINGNISEIRIEEVGRVVG